MEWETKTKTSQNLTWPKTRPEQSVFLLIFMVSASIFLVPAHTLSLPHTQGFLCRAERSEPDQSSFGAAPLWLWWNCWVAFTSSQTFYESERMFRRRESGYVCSNKNMFLCVCLFDRGLNGEQVSTASGMESHIVHRGVCQLKLALTAWM